jgi:hypothetical protein
MKPVGVKIFLLPKSATQSPRNALSRRKAHSRDIDRATTIASANSENICGTGLSCNIGPRMHRILANFSRCCAHALRRC